LKKRQSTFFLLFVLLAKKIDEIFVAELLSANLSLINDGTEKKAEPPKQEKGISLRKQFLACCELSARQFRETA
jgi:hypothetical protein